VLTLFKEIFVAYSKNNIKHTNTLCGRNAVLLNVKADGTRAKRGVTGTSAFSSVGKWGVNTCFINLVLC
jgi:hypothetical protein